jgi:hypothetical protein
MYIAGGRARRCRSRAPTTDRDRYIHTYIIIYIYLYIMYIYIYYRRRPGAPASLAGTYQRQRQIYTYILYIYYNIYIYLYIMCVYIISQAAGRAGVAGGHLPRDLQHGPPHRARRPLLRLLNREEEEEEGERLLLRRGEEGVRSGGASGRESILPSPAGCPARSRPPALAATRGPARPAEDALAGRRSARRPRRRRRRRRRRFVSPKPRDTFEPAAGRAPAAPRRAARRRQSVRPAPPAWDSGPARAKDILSFRGGPFGARVPCERHPLSLSGPARARLGSRR